MPALHALKCLLVLLSARTGVHAQALFACIHTALEFKDVIADLEEEVAEMQQQVQDLERYTVDSISMEVWGPDTMGG